MRSNELKGAVAIVTAASSGVEWQTAVRLAEQGARLCVTARRGEVLERLRQVRGARRAEIGDRLLGRFGGRGRARAWG